MEKNIFNVMVRLQHKFNQQVAKDYLDKKFNWNSAIIVESGELLESLGFKWWKHQIPDMENVKVEAIDLLHFVISYELQRKYDNKVSYLEKTAEDFQNSFTLVNNRNPHLSELVDELNLNVHGRFFTMKAIFNNLNMSNEDVYIAYITKNCLNKFRQDNGYKDGSYIKNWNGREDNIVAFTIANEWGADEELFDLLYRDLEIYYFEEVKGKK
ncbi:MAG: dUTP diphosphatase [Aliarcobacter sp.]|nr:dUTP diphosphatase [Aliarcobacter sp.]